MDNLEDKAYLSGEVRRWTYLTGLFSSENGRVVANGIDQTDDYKKWADWNLKYAVDALGAYQARKKVKDSNPEANVAGST